MEENKENINNEENIFITSDLLRKLRREGKYEYVYELLKRAHFENQGSLFLAKEYLIAVIDFKPHKTRYIKRTADLLIKSGKYQDFANYGYVMYYLQLNDVEKAYEYYQKIEHLSNLTSKVNNRLANYPCSKEFRKLTFNVDRAIKELDQDYTSGKRYIYLSFDIGDYYFQKRDYMKAIEYYEKSASKREDRAKGICYYKIASCYFNLQYLEKAVEYHYLALDYTDDQKLKNKTIHELILALILLGQFDEALNYCDILDKGSVKDKNISTCLRVRVYRDTGKIEEAISLAKTLLDGEKKDRYAMLRELVGIYRLLHDEGNIFKYLDILEQEYPYKIQMLKMKTLFECKRYDEVIEYAKTLRGSEYEAYAIYMEGRSKLMLRQFSEAKELIEGVVDSIYNHEAYLDLGTTYDKLSMYEEAYDMYLEYFKLRLSIGDLKGAGNGLLHIFDLLIGQYKYAEALEYIHEFEKYQPEETTTINRIYAQYYFRTQNYNLSENYFKKLFGTELENYAKTQLIVIYRYTDRREEIPTLLNELEDTEYKPYADLNRAFLLKDSVDERDLYTVLYTISSLKYGNMKIDSMIFGQEIEILIKVKYYRKALSRLEEGYKDGLIEQKLYDRFKDYINIKLGEDVESEDVFMGLCQKYSSRHALNTIYYCNQNGVGNRTCYLTEDQLTDLFDYFRDNHENLNHYFADLYDVYVIDMGHIIGKYYETETRYIEIRCEQNTTNIHMIQPTCKRINVNKNTIYTRKR